MPLIYKGKVIGVLDLEHTKRRFFTEDHMRTMTTLAAQIAIAIENATLYERVPWQEQRLERDLALARELAIPPAAGKLSFAGERRTGRASSFRRTQLAAISTTFSSTRRTLPEAARDCIGIAIGDVSGKGAAAALYAALVSGFLRSHAAERPGAAEMLRLINASLAERRVDAQYVTACLCHLGGRGAQPADRELRTCLAPFIASKGKIERVEAVGLPLGLFDTVEHEQIHLQRRPRRRVRLLQRRHRRRHQSGRRPLRTRSY